MKVKVLPGEQIADDVRGGVYSEGSVIELPDDVAAALIKAKRVAKAERSKK